jgi:hypothetical protein
MITENEWRIWTRGRIADEREFGLRRVPGNGYDGLKERWTGVDEYAAIFSREQIAKAEYDTIGMDVDAHNGEDWRVKARMILSRVSIQPSRLYVTGRGVHMYWDLEVPIHGTGLYKQVVAAIVCKWGIRDLVDTHVVGDVRRVMRLPGSRNSKGGVCMRVDGLDGFWDPNLSQELPDSLATKDPEKVEITIHEAAGVAEGMERTFAPNPEAKHVFNESAYPPCIRVGIKTMMETGELDHQERLHLFSFLVQNDEQQKGWNLLKEYAGDFNAGISEYQLNYLREKNMNPFKCANVPMTICPYANKRDCVYWPSISLHRRVRLEGK